MPRKSLSGLAATFVLAALTGPAAAQPDSRAELSQAALIRTLEQVVAPLPGRRPSAPAPLLTRMAEEQVPGVSIAYVANGRVQWARAYGLADAKTSRPMTVGTALQAGSLSKAVAAAILLRLVDQRLLTLDGDIGTKLRRWRPPADPVHSGPFSLRQLLSHTGGFTVDGYDGYAAGTAVPDIARSLAGLPPADSPPVRRFARPGAELGYSGGGYSIAQLAASEVGGRAFPDLAASMVLRPLGMSRSTFSQLPAHPRLAAGHDEHGRSLQGKHRSFPEMAAAGLWTTPSDYGRFLIAIQDANLGRRGAVLKRSSAQAMLTPVLGDYGLGVQLVEAGGRRIITHGGSNTGFESRFVAFLDGQREGLVIMTNGSNGGRLAAGLQRTIADAMRWPDALVRPIPRAPD